MEGLLPATASAFQLVLQRLCGALLGIPESLRLIPGPTAFPWGILVGTLVVVSVILKGRRASRSVKTPGARCSAHRTVCARCSENTGPIAGVNHTLMSPGAGASPLLLQTLCLRALSKHLSKLPRQDTVYRQKTARNSQPPELSQGTDEKPISEASGMDGEPLPKNRMDGLNKDFHYPESPKLCQGEIMGWKQEIQEEEEGEQRLGQANTGMRQVLKVRGGQSMSVAGNPKPDDLGHHLYDGNLEFPQKREAEKGDQFIHESEVDIKGIPHDADASLSLQSTDQGHQDIARQVWEQKQRNEELAAEITNLKTEKASLQRENSSLQDEIQQLKLKLEVAPDEDPVTQLQKKLFEAEMCGLEMEKKFFNTWRNMNSNYQFMNMYRNMVQDMNQELRRSTFYYENEIRYHQRRAEEACMAAKITERKLQYLWRENEHNKQMLAQVKSKFQPFPSDPFVPADLPHSPQRPKVSGHGSSSPQEEGHTVRAEESSVICSCDSASTSDGT
uniref:Cutaneous T-cell lymphoma-associated antigen 5 n=1 Tax=Pipistrellus kuhlii TaxID=59472 RepID=A0A7J7ZJW6_PIPKU|nr:hypothetical protein mPipKuh1_009470 [Pipistrellus kuhlii]